MTRTTIGSLFLALALGALASPVGATTYNDSSFLGAGQRTKVSSAIAGSRLHGQGASEIDEGQLLEGRCRTGNLNVGSILVPAGTGVPDEVVVVVEGDVINVNNGFGPSGC
jgi:hypothetical protein